MANPELLPEPTKTHMEPLPSTSTVVLPAGMEKDGSQEPDECFE